MTRKWKSLDNFHIPSSYKPCLIITDLNDDQNIENIRNFIRNFKNRVLNISGHRNEVVVGFSDSIRSILVKALAF
jgi:hypothetical protein